MSDVTPRGEGNESLAWRRERKRRYREANRERIRQRYRDWRKANPDKVEAQHDRSQPGTERYDPEYREKVLAQKRIAERRRAERVKKEKQARARATERTRKYDSAHPEQVRERERRYRETHREQIRERQRAYYARNKEQIKARNAERFDTDPRYQEFHQRYREANREKIHERQRAYRTDPDVYQRALEYNRQWRQRERRRLKAGLPRLSLHRTHKSDKEANAEAAGRFFTRERNEKERHRIAAELDQLRDEKERAERIVRRRRAERIANARERAARIDDYLARHGRKLREEVRLDSRARELRGAEPYPDLEAEARRRAMSALGERASQQSSRYVSTTIQQGRQSRIDWTTGPIVGASSRNKPRLEI